MKVFIDGVLVDALNDVKIIAEDPESGHELHATFGPEGFVFDLVKDGEVVETEGEQYVDLIVEMLP
jgi:hypothetical protein